MFLLGYFDDGMPVMGLPGCVMYAGATIFDLILPRIAAGVEVTRADITAFGEGGLCLGCGSKNNTDDTQNTTPDDAQTPAETVELTVFAAASLTESLTAIGERYMAENENVKISFNFDSSGKLYTQITEGAVDCGIIYASDAYSADLTVAVCLPEGPYSAVVQRVVRDLHATVVLLRPVNGGEEVMLRAILPEGAAAAAGETVRFDLLAEKCLCCG